MGTPRNPVVGLRVEPAHVERLQRLAGDGADRATVTREALMRGLESLEMEHAQTGTWKMGAAPQRGPRPPTEDRMNDTGKAKAALVLIDELEAKIPLPATEAAALTRLLGARAELVASYDAIQAGRAAREQVEATRARLKRERDEAAAKKAIAERDKRIVAEAEAFARMQKAAEEAKDRGLVPAEGKAS